MKFNVDSTWQDEDVKSLCIRLKRKDSKLREKNAEIMALRSYTALKPELLPKQVITIQRIKLSLCVGGYPSKSINKGLSHAVSQFWEL